MPTRYTVTVTRAVEVVVFAPDGVAPHVVLTAVRAEANDLLRHADTNLFVEGRKTVSLEEAAAADRREAYRLRDDHLLLTDEEVGWIEGLRSEG